MLHNSESLHHEYFKMANVLSNYLITIEQILKTILFHNICFRIGWFVVRINVNKHDSCNSFPFKKGIKIMYYPHSTHGCHRF